MILPKPEQPKLEPKPEPEKGLSLNLTNEELESLYFYSRYVFAPVCRGVTSKRSDPTIIQNPKIYESILEQIRKNYNNNNLINTVSRNKNRKRSISVTEK